MAAKFVMNCLGDFLIEVDGFRSSPVLYRGIAILKHPNGKTYAGVSAYHEGSLPHETVFEIKKLDDVKNVEENFSWESGSPARLKGGRNLNSHQLTDEGQGI